jgi:hypothetical protein
MPGDDDPCGGTDPLPADRAPASAEAFHEHLESLVRAAADQGVDVRGNWPVTGDDGTWSIKVDRIDRRSRTTATEDRLVLAVLETVAVREGVDVTDLPSLFDVIDPELLDAVFRGDGDGGGRRQRLQFDYCGYLVTVRGDGVVIVDE